MKEIKTFSSKAWDRDHFRSPEGPQLWTRAVCEDKNLEGEKVVPQHSGKTWQCTCTCIYFWYYCVLDNPDHIILVPCQALFTLCLLWVWLKKGNMNKKIFSQPCKYHSFRKKLLLVQFYGTKKKTTISLLYVQNNGNYRANQCDRFLFICFTLPVILGEISGPSYFTSYICYAIRISFGCISMEKLHFCQKYA